MREQRWPTLADARRQVWWRGGIGILLIALGLISLLLILVKNSYLTPSGGFFIPNWGPALRRLINPLLHDWPILAWLWQAIPPWHPASPWEVVYGVYGAFAVIVFGLLLLRSASCRWAQIREFRWEMQREAWRQQMGAAQELAPDDRGSTTVIGQAVWYEYTAPPEPWSQTLWGVRVLGLGIPLVGGVILLYLEYGYFQPRWPSGRN